jgi:E3 ubiquitin-protein ligase BRE1
MQHYSRENARNEARVAELERLNGSYEASLAIMGSCWTQVLNIAELRLLFEPYVLISIPDSRDHS